MGYKRKRRLKDYSSDYKISRDYLALKKMYARKDKTLLDSGFYDTETWAGLHKCWKGYKIAKAEGDTVNMVHYAKGIRKLEMQLGIPVMDFPQFGLIGRLVEEEEHDDDSDYSTFGSSRRVEQDLKDYESQLRKELQYDVVHRIDDETDSIKTQMEFYRQINRFNVDPGSFMY
jgi:hypothetical protein